jgi:LEA14-like dessication related protein
MKIRTTLIALVFSLTILSCDVLNQVLSFANCKYEIAGLAEPSIAGISLSNINNINNLNAISLLKLSSALLSGSLPMSITVNVNATNPNATKAEIEGLEWALDLENKTLFTGNVGSRISIPANGGKTVIPLSFQVDIMDVLKGESKDNILSFVQGVLDVGDASSKVSFKIKPSVMIGGQRISTPDFITLSKTVGN